MLRDGQRCLGSHEVVAGVMAMSAHLTQDAGGAHAASGKQKRHKRDSLTSAQRSEGSGEGHVLFYYDAVETKSGTISFLTHILQNLSSSTEDVSCLPALVGPFRGELVAAAAVWGVAKGSIRGGGAWPGTDRTGVTPAGLKVPIR